MSKLDAEVSAIHLPPTIICSITSSQPAIWKPFAVIFCLIVILIFLSLFSEIFSYPFTYLFLCVKFSCRQDRVCGTGSLFAFYTPHLHVNFSPSDLEFAYQGPLLWSPAVRRSFAIRGGRVECGYRSVWHVMVERKKENIGFTWFSFLTFVGCLFVYFVACYVGCHLFFLRRGKWYMEKVGSQIECGYRSVWHVVAERKRKILVLLLFFYLFIIFFPALFTFIDCLFIMLRIMWVITYF